MNRIKELRKKSGKTQAELGLLLNVKKAAVSKYETGNVTISIDILKKLSDIFGVSTDYILNITDNPIIESNDNDQIDITTKEGYLWITQKMEEEGLIFDHKNMSKDDLQLILKVIKLAKELKS